MMLLFFRELAPVFMLIIALMEIGLEYKWSDRRTKKHKILRAILIVLLICSAIVTMVMIGIGYKKEEMIESSISNIPKNFEEIFKKLNKETYKEWPKAPKNL